MSGDFNVFIAHLIFAGNSVLSLRRTGGLGAAAAGYSEFNYSWKIHKFNKFADLLATVELWWFLAVIFPNGSASSSSTSWLVVLYFCHGLVVERGKWGEG